MTTEDRTPAWPLLMDLKTASRYTGVAFWTIRGLIIDGLIPRVILPGRHGPSRRVLVHRTDLDAFLFARRERNVQPIVDGHVMTKAVVRAEKRLNLKGQQRPSVQESAVRQPTSTGSRRGVGATSGKHEPFTVSETRNR